MRIVFCGTPEFAVPSLERLASSAIEVIAAVCQPDRPSGRGQALTAPAVKIAATRLGIPVAQPASLRGPEAVAWLEQQQADALVVVAFGQILPRTIFSLPRWGAINAHASLLPRYRGAAPIQWAIANGETETGVTTMRIEAGLDTGDILLQRAVPIAPDETAPELSATLANLSAELLLETLAGLAAGTLEGRPQGEPHSLAPRLTRADGRIDWRGRVAAIYNRWRGFQPWPGATCQFRGQSMAIVECEPAPAQAVRHDGVASPPPGLLVESRGALFVRCGDGELEIRRVRLEGRRALSAAEFMRGARIEWGHERLE